MSLKYAKFPPVDPAEQLTGQHLKVTVGTTVVIDKDYPVEAEKSESFDVDPGTTGVIVTTDLTRTNAKGSTTKTQTFPFEAPKPPEVPAPAEPGDVTVVSEEAKAA